MWGLRKEMTRGKARIAIANGYGYGCEIFCILRQGLELENRRRFALFKSRRNCENLFITQSVYSHLETVLALYIFGAITFYKY